MEIDNLIYIIITIIIFAVSLIGQSKRKKAPEPHNAEEESYSLNDFEQIIRKKEEYLLPENKTVEIEPLKAEKKPEVKIEQEKNVSNRRTSKQETEVDDGFDIKSAIIYSSILERKKFRRI
jgi:Na+-transporting methylmalonyl-CoA/oxaloacetate decarboxylase gamma subunit